MNARLLIVDDDILVALDIAETLRKIGYETALAHSAADAIERADAFRPTAVLMDINLGRGMDGVDTARVIYDRFAIPSIFVTAYSDARTRARLNPMGRGVLPKPFTKDQLSKIVAPLLSDAEIGEVALH
jgi:CheY-like chemotaxis protein